MRNLVEEHKNEEDEEYSETNPEINDSIKSKISKGITEKNVIISLLAKTNIAKSNQISHFIHLHLQTGHDRS